MVLNASTEFPLVYGPEDEALDDEFHSKGGIYDLIRYSTIYNVVTEELSNAPGFTIFPCDWRPHVPGAPFEKINRKRSSHDC